MELRGDRKLIMVTADNNNKFYHMHDNGDGTFTVEWGRVGATSSETTYPIKKWDTMYRQKTKKGYKDVTEMFVTEEESGDTFEDIQDRIVASLVKELQAFANRSVKENYLVTSESVTERQIEEAQGMINQLARAQIKTPQEANELLLEVYAIIPRRMSNVRYHLFGADSRIGSFTKDTLNRVISNEQATLDVMRGQVSTQTKSNKATDKSHSTLLDAMGLEISQTDQKDVDQIIKLLGPNARQFKKAYRIINTQTQDKFDRRLHKAENKTTQLFWHGSRNENWWSILDTGLVLRPANAVTTGKMFGYGIYFADKAQKSMGYTSLRGSYWARGSASKAYLALFDVHVGNWLHARRHEYWMYDLSERKLKARGNYDSLFAEGGVDLRNNEYVVYNDSQCTVKYLIEIAG